MAKKKTTTKKKTRPRKAEAKSRRKAGGAPRRKVPNPHLDEILAGLAERHPDADCALNYRNPFELLIATILSAQCTDVRVNMVTAELFQKYDGPADLAAVSQEELEEDIRSTGFYRNKAKNIRACCADLMEKYDGEVPQDMEALSALAGVGRKTANVVLGNAFGKPAGVVVDTHVRRISQKLGLTNQEDPVKIERELNQIIPEDQWVVFPHRMIHHGREVCNARSPKCDECNLYPYCPTRA